MKISKFWKYFISIGVILILIFCLLIGLQVILWAIKLILIGALIMFGIIISYIFFNKKPENPEKKENV
jgi:hypothetical protein